MFVSVNSSRWFRLCLGLLVLGAISGVGSVRAADANRPNIILLFADDQRPDTIQAWGNPHIETPSLDRLVAEGFSFRRNYVAGSYSGAVCVASRTMLMTGRHWLRVEDRKNWSGLPLLPELLAQSGYRTFISGKWHNGRTTLARAFQSGRRVFMGGMSDHTKVPLVDLTEAGELVNPRMPPGFSSALFADAAIEFLNDQDGDSDPFFLYVAFTAPHDPRNPPESYRERYYGDRPPLPPNFLPQHPFDNGFVTRGGRDESLATWPRSRSDVSDQLCEYYGLITHLDEQVGRVLEAIDKLPAGRETYVVYTADHGLAMGSHGLLGKQNIYEHSVRSPMVVRGPDVPAGGSTESLNYIHDLYATFCGLADVTVPDSVDAEDLRPLWRGEKEQLRASQFLPFQATMRAVTDGRWKLHRYPETNHQMLFDLEADPHETLNLAGDPDYRHQVTRMLGLLQDWQTRLDDPLPLSTENPKPLRVDFSKVKRTLDRWQPGWIRDKYFGGRNDPNHGK